MWSGRRASSCSLARCLKLKAFAVYEAAQRAGGKITSAKQQSGYGFVVLWTIKVRSGSLTREVGLPCGVMVTS